MNYLIRDLEDMADLFYYFLASSQFGEHNPTDCRKCRADRIYRDILELKALCEAQEKKESK